MPRENVSERLITVLHILQEHLTYHPSLPVFNLAGAHMADRISLQLKGADCPEGLCEWAATLDGARFHIVRINTEVTHVHVYGRIPDTAVELDVWGGPVAALADWHGFEYGIPSDVFQMVLDRYEDEKVTT